MLNALALSIFDCFAFFQRVRSVRIDFENVCPKVLWQNVCVCFARFVCGRESDFLSADEIIDAHVKIVRKFPKAFD